jgi:hypothetical protein
MAITDLFVNNPSDRAVVYPSWALRISSEKNGFRSTQYPNEVASQFIYTPPEKTSQVSPQLRPRKVSWTAGGSQVDYAQVDWVGNDSIVNRTSQPSEFVRMCDVLLPSRKYLGDDDADLIDPETGKISESAKAFKYGGNVRLILGDYVSEAESVDETESLSSQIAVTDMMYGRRLPGFTCWDYYAADPDEPGDKEAYYEKLVECAEIVFNPAVDGTVRGNKASNFSSFDHVWIDYSIGESDAAKKYFGQTVSEWSLPEALQKILQICNTNETYVRNPVIDESDLLWEGAPALKNVILPTGNYLPYYLDALLHPNGYNWFLDPQTNVEVTGVSYDIHIYEKPIIRIFRRGWSLDPPKELNFQPPNSSLDLSKSNVNAYQVDRTIADAYNGVRVLGGKIKVEMTIPIYKAWSKAEDKLTADQLSMSKGSHFKNHRTAHRLYVANEWAGFYDETEENGIQYVQDFNSYFTYEMPDNDGVMQGIFGLEGNVPRKRVIEPPLTYQGNAADRIRRDLLVEYKGVGQNDVWTEVTSDIGSWAVLEDQIGIYFNDDKPPEVLMELRYFLMRITGTITSDANLWNKFTEFPKNVDKSVVGRLRSLTINKEEEFRLWYVLGKNNPRGVSNPDAAYASVLANDPAGAETHDDRQALVDYGKSILRNVRHAEYSANFSLPGWHTEYRIGDLLSKINGREIGLNQSADPDDPRYMQITGIEWEHSDEAGPTTRIIVDRGMDDSERQKTVEFGPKPSLADTIRYYSEKTTRDQILKEQSSAHPPSVAMDRMRGVTR